MIKYVLRKVLRLPMLRDQDHWGRKLQASQMSDASQCCPTCGYTGDRKPLLAVQDDPYVAYLECPNCRGCSTSWMPTPTYLAEYYGSYYEPEGPKITFPSSAGRFARHIAQATLGGFTGSKLRILDFGGGDGTIGKEIAGDFLASHPNATVKIVVADYLEPAPFTQDRLEFSSVRTLDQAPVAGFDLIVASAILEHVPDLAVTLPVLFRAAAPGGMVYIRVPWVLPLKRWFRSVPLLWPMHVHDLGPSFWNRLPERGVLGEGVFCSRPPLSETEFCDHFLLTLLSHLMKLPTRVELLLRRRPKDHWWRLVAGWEVIYRMTGRT
jgi:SAM-dependent methyltransferase